MVAAEDLSDVLQGVAPAPSLPHQGFLSILVVNLLPLLHGNTPSAQAGLVCCIHRLNPQP